MPAESIFEPIPTVSIRSARARLAYEGLTAEQWAEQNGFSPRNVRAVLSGTRMAIRGEALKIAVALGLRAAPGAPAGQPEGLPPHGSPAGRTVGAGAPIGKFNRRPVLTGDELLGEALR